MSQADRIISQSERDEDDVILGESSKASYPESTGKIVRLKVLMIQVMSLPRLSKEMSRLMMKS